MKKEKGIDDIFKHSLQNPVNEPDFAEHDWDALQNMLDRKDKGGRIVWLPYLSAAAAVVLIAFCWWMFKPTGTSVQNNQVVKNQTPQAVVGTADSQQPQISTSSSSKGSNVVAKTEGATKNEIAVIAKSKTQEAYLAGAANTAKRNKQTDFVSAHGFIAPRLVTTDIDIKNGDYISAAWVPVYNEVNSAVPQVPVLTKIITRPLAAVNLPADKPKALAIKPQFALAVIASPEINGVGSFQGASKGTNVGMMFTVGISKFTLSTGASYSLKPYSLPFSQYPSTYSFKTRPETVTADCRILDIPINIGYQVYNKSRNKFTLGTGVSSYIMMHESYTYDYGSASTVYGPSYYAVKGKGKYPFSVMNVQATYERQINSKFGLSIQPYYKIPLSEIGYSQVKVQTFGVAVGLNWNINSLTKPK